MRNGTWIPQNLWHLKAKEFDFINNLLCEVDAHDNGKDPQFLAFAPFPGHLKLHSVQYDADSSLQNVPS